MPVNKFLFQDGTEIKKYVQGTPEGISNTDAIPDMNANTVTVNGRTYTAYASGSLTGYQPYMAFSDDINSSTWYCNTVQGWIGIDFGAGNEKIIQKYSIMCAPSNTNPKNWTFEGSNDNVNWVILHTASNVTDWSSSNTKTYTFSNNTAYRYYRINITANNGNTSFTDVGEIQMFEYIPATPGSWQTVGTAPATKSMFDQHGMTDLSIIDHNAIQQLTSDTPELLCWTDEEDSILEYTGDLCTGGTAISLPVGYNGDVASKAFDDNVNTRWDGYDGNGVANRAYIGYDFGAGNAKHIRKVTLVQSNTGGVTGMKVQRSDDGATWLDVASFTVQLTTNKQEFLLPASAPSRYWRLFATTGAANGWGWSVNEVEMMEVANYGPPSRQVNITAVPLPQLLLPVGDIEVEELESVVLNSTVSGNGVVKVLVSGDNGVSWKGAESNFGFVNIVPTMTGANVPSPYNVTESSYFATSTRGWRLFDGDDSIRWVTAQKTNQYVSIDLGSPKQVDKVEIVCDIPDGGPKDWRIEGSNNGSSWTSLLEVSNTSWVDNPRQEFTLTSTGQYRYYRFYILTHTGGDYIQINTLKLLSLEQTGINLVDVSLTGNEPKEKGMTPNQFNALTKEELATLFPNGKARFAFYLEQEKSTDIVQIDSLKINEKVYTMTPSIESLKVIYNLLESEKPKLYVSRDDGVNWKEVQPDTLTSLEDLPEGNKLRVKAVLSNGQELHALSYSWI
jgi:hypothetical protein